MQSTSSEYKNEIKQPSRSFECRVTIGKNVYTNKDIVDIILDFPQAQDGFSIGNTISQSLELTLFKTGEEIYSTNQIKIELGIKIGDVIEYLPMGYYNVDEVSKNDYTIKFTAFDNMMKFETPYFSSLGDKPTLQQVVNELATITGISFVGSIPSYTVTKLEGYTCREVLSYVASLCGGNALITRDGKFTIKTPQNVECAITTENHFGLITEEVPYKLGKITCLVNTEVELSKGAMGTDSMELSFENPWMTEGILNTLYQQLNGFSYLGFETKWQGDLSLDPYDSVLIQDKKGASHRVPILSQKFTYVGGLTSEIGAKGESKNKNSFSSNGSNTNKMNRLVTEQAVIKEALINKANIQDLEAVSIRTQSLEATIAKIQDAIIDVAHISDLNAVNAKIESLQATDVTIQNAIINKADISELNAAVANINILNADLGVIKHLVNGNLSSENIQAGGITSDKLTIANGFIKDAMIDSLHANKITAGQINTALVQVSSASGNLVINDNTIQIRDANRVRVQIGRDASNDYSMSVWDSSGKLMFDARGLKADAIKDSIIRDEMISANANIDGSKLNISSVVSSINHGSSTLKASKVQFDGIAQTLEVAFNVLKTQADGTKTQTESNTTDISVAQGQIKTLIQDTTITKDGQMIKLKDEYSRLEQTVSRLSSTIGNQQTVIDEHTGEITATNSELSSLKQNVNGLTASVSSAQTTIQTHTQQLAQKADLTTVDDRLSNLQIGVQNYIRDYKFKKSDVWKRSSASITSIDTDNNCGILIGTTSNPYLYQNFENGLFKVGDTLTLQYEIKCEGVSANAGTNSFLIRTQLTGYTSSGTYVRDVAIFGKHESNGEYADYTDWTKVVKTVTITGEKNFDYLALRLYARNFTGNIYFRNVKLERGNKATDLSYAPEDVQAAIDVKANSDDVYVKTEVYTKAQTDAAIKLTKDQINLGVSSTYETKANVSAQINGVNVSISSLQTRMSTAEQKITDTAITDIVKQNFYTKTETEAQITSKGYATSVEVQQTAAQVEYKFTQSGGFNLLYNSDFRRGTDKWSITSGAVYAVNKGGLTCPNGTGIRFDGILGVSKYMAQDVTSNGMFARQFTASGYVYISNDGTDGSAKAFRLYVRMTYSDGTKTYHYTNINSTSYNTWQRVYVTFDRDTSKTLSEIRFTMEIKDTTRKMYLSQLMLEEGPFMSSWSPNPNEVRDGFVTIDNDGITVTSSNINGYTQMSSSGFTINKNNTDVFKVDSDGLAIRGSGSNSGRYIKIENEDYTVWNGNVNCMRFGYKNWNGWDGVPEFLMGYKGMRYSTSKDTGEDASYFGMQTWGRNVRSNEHAYHDIYYRSDKYADQHHVRFTEDGLMQLKSLKRLELMGGSNVYVQVDTSGGLTFPQGVKTFGVSDTIWLQGSNFGMVWGKYSGKEEYNFRPTNNNLTDLGHASYRFRTIYATNGTVNTSDINLKENIVPILSKQNDEVMPLDIKASHELSSEDFYHFVKDLPLYSYDYKSETPNRSLHNIGFIAQDIANTLVGDEFVFKGEDGIYQYNMQGYVGVLAAALQKAINEIELLKIQLNTR